MKWSLHSHQHQRVGPLTTWESSVYHFPVMEIQSMFSFSPNACNPLMAFTAQLWIGWGKNRKATDKNSRVSGKSWVRNRRDIITGNRGPWPTASLLLWLGQTCKADQKKGDAIKSDKWLNQVRCLVGQAQHSSQNLEVFLQAVWRAHKCFANLVRGFPGDCTVKNLLAVQETQETCVRSLVWENPLVKGMSTHSIILTWRIPWTEESGRL